MLNLEQRKAFQEVRERTQLSVDLSELAMPNPFGFDYRCSNTVEHLPQLFRKIKAQHLPQLSGTSVCFLKPKTAERLVPANSWSRTRKGSRRSTNNWDNGSTLGELTKLTYPDSSIAERTYHDTGALHLLRLDGSTISTRTYDDGRRLTGETLGNGVTETRTYSTDNLLTGISYGGTGTSIGNLSYTWDANKNKTSDGFGGTMSGYGFTSAGTSYTVEDSRLFSESCDNFSFGTTRILE